MPSVVSDTDTDVATPAVQGTDEELALVLAALAEKQRESPLEFLELMPGQIAAAESTASTVLIFGGNRPIAYGSVVRMADGGIKKIEDINVGDFVLTFNGFYSYPTKVIAIPYDEYDECFKITTGSGLEVEATADHCFPSLLSQKAEIRNHTVMEIKNAPKYIRRLISGGAQHYITNSVPFSGLLLGLFLGDGSYGQSPSRNYPRPFFTNTEDWLKDLWKEEVKNCYPSLRSVIYPSDKSKVFVSGTTKGKNYFVNDLIKLGLTVKCYDKFVPDIFKVSDVGTRRGIIKGMILTDGGCDRYKTTIYSTSMRMLNDLDEIIVSLGGRCRIYVDHLPDNENQKKGYKLQFSNEFIKIMGIEGLNRKTPKFDLIRNPRRDDLTIKSVDSVGVKRCRCITVKDPSHLFVLANGIVTSNSGKTTPDAAIVIKAALSRPRMKIWVCGETFQDSIAIQQAKIHQLVPSREVKYGSFDDINGYTNRKLQFNNGSLVSFKSYDQGRTAFQSDDIDLVICDEEPPLDIIKEIKMRLIDRNGRLVISMTSLKGITDFIRDYFEDCDILETRWAPLVRKNLPVRGRKGSVEIFFLWTTDNKYIDQKRLMDEVKLMGESDVMARIYGMPVNLAGKIYMSFGRETHVIPLDDVPTTGNQLWNVLDPHDRKPWAMGWYLVNKNETVYCVDEYPNADFNDMLYDDKTFEEYANIIADKEKVLRQVFNCGGRVRRVIDPNFGHKTVQLAQRKGGQSKTTPVKELERLGLRYRDAIDALESGHLEVRKWLHWERKELSDGRKQLTVVPKFLIADNCKNHINHLSRYSRRDIMASDGDVKDKVAPQQKYKDYCDLVRYLLMANPHFITEERWTPPKNKVY